jgi:hypothetical protein
MEMQRYATRAWRDKKVHIIFFYRKLEGNRWMGSIKIDVKCIVRP